MFLVSSILLPTATSMNGCITPAADTGASSEREHNTGRVAALRRRLQAIGLTPRQMQCLSLYYYDGLSQGQIGVHLGIGQRVVSQHLTYGRRKLASARLTLRRVTMEDDLKIAHMDTDSLDGLSPELTRGLW